MVVRSGHLVRLVRPCGFEVGLGLQVVCLLQVGLLQVGQGVQRVGLLRVGRSPASSVPSVSTFCLSTFSGTGVEVGDLQQVGLLQVGRVVVVVAVLVVVIVQIGPEGESPLHLAQFEVPGVVKSPTVLGVSPGPLAASL